MRRMHARTSDRLGRFFFMLFWLLLFALLYFLFDNYLHKRNYPNQHLSDATQPNTTVILQRGPKDHYIAPGTINQQPVNFLLDTGASALSIPATVAQRIGLSGGIPQQVMTAAGKVEVYQVQLATVNLGGIQLNNIQAYINPHMSGDIVLLGMSFLRHLKLLQQGDQLTLSL